MTFEHKIVVELDDIKAVSLECRQCHTRVTMSPDAIHIPDVCPGANCDNVWMAGDPANYQSVTSPHMNFINAIGKIRKELGKGAPFTILLEFDDVERKRL
jgi:hypothetical protein